jgi:DNA invertase Pin-like site-specific DNA recombinase
MKYKYARVSTINQDLEAQLRAFEQEGWDKIYSEKFTGTRADRPQFQDRCFQTNFFSRSLKSSSTPTWF